MLSFIWFFIPVVNYIYCFILISNFILGFILVSNYIWRFDLISNYILRIDLISNCFCCFILTFDCIWKFVLILNFIWRFILVSFWSNRQNIFISLSLNFSQFDNLNRYENFEFNFILWHWHIIFSNLLRVICMNWSLYFFSLNWQVHYKNNPFEYFEFQNSGWTFFYRDFHHLIDSKLYWWYMNVLLFKFYPWPFFILIRKETKLLELLRVEWVFLCCSQL